MAPEPSVTEILDELARRVDERVAPDGDLDDRAFAHVRLALDVAGQHAHVGEDIPAGARARPVKKALVDSLRPVTSYQRVFNERVLEALETLTGLVHAQARAEHPLEPRMARLNASVATVDVAIDEVTDRVRELDDRLADVEASSAAAATTDPLGRPVDVQSLLARITALEARLEGLRQRLAPAGPTTHDPTGAPSGRHPAEPLDDDRAHLLVDLEDAFRGTRAEIRALQEPYVADVTGTGSAATVVDVGCGRGEWLEILRDRAIPAYGLDINPLMVATCTERGLDARCGDGIDHLATLPEASLAAVTAFHVVEHLAFDDLVALLDAAYVALASDGVLVLETPDCTNVTVGASTFHLDPTHLRPLHPQLLEFLCRQRGFADVEIRPLHPRRTTHRDTAGTARRSGLAPAMVADLDRMLNGPMDCAVVATKSTGPGSATATNAGAPGTV